MALASKDSPGRWRSVKVTVDIDICFLETVVNGIFQCLGMFANPLVRNDDIDLSEIFDDLVQRI